MVSGGFDPLHPGHLAYFRAAAALGAPLLVNVSHDEWVGRKHVPLLTQAERIQVIDALEMVDYVHAEQGPTFEVLALCARATSRRALTGRGGSRRRSSTPAGTGAWRSSSWTRSSTRRPTCCAASGNAAAEGQARGLSQLRRNRRLPASSRSSSSIRPRSS